MPRNNEIEIEIEGFPGSEYNPETGLVTLEVEDPSISRRGFFDIVRSTAKVFAVFGGLWGVAKLFGVDPETFAEDLRNAAIASPVEQEIILPDPPVLTDSKSDPNPPPVNGTEPLKGKEIDSKFIASPYWMSDGGYNLTQGIHGQKYDTPQMAIDFSGGDGHIIRSPINGIVTDISRDKYNNTQIYIENDKHRILMLHGKYKKSLVGTQVAYGDVVGTESNIGYTWETKNEKLTFCGEGSPCGYHTHFNIFDKEKNNNVNPLKVIQDWPWV